MKLSMNRLALMTDKSDATMEHNGVTITWNIALFDKTSMPQDFDIFEQINGYWEHLEPSLQQKIFNVFSQIRNVFDEIWDKDELTQRLYPLVRDLYAHHDLAKIRHWIDFHSNLRTPDGLKDSFKESYETPGTRERTYLREDYRWLVALSIAMRVMIPVWGEFVSRTRRDMGTVWKEYYAFRLLAHSTIGRSEPMERLRVYVEHSLPADKSKASAILGGISSEDFPVWILALVVVRRLCVGDVRGLDPNSSLVTFIYRYIGQKVKGHDQSFAGIVKDKIVEGQNADGENNLSKLEGYKVKQEIPAGDIETMAFYMQDLPSLTQRICPDIDLALLTASQQSVKALATHRIEEPQMVLVQWVMRGVIPPRGLMHLPKTLVLDAIAVSQACLWHRGHHELAALGSAMAQGNGDELQLGGVDSRARIPKEMVEELFALYPYSRRPTGKQKTVRPPSVAAIAIDSMSNLLSQNDWRLTLPPDWVAQLTGSRNNRRYSVPHDIKIKLASLAIAIAKREF